MAVTEVHTDDQLAELCQRHASTAWVGVDCEFERETTYFPKLCLLQLGTDDGHVFLLDGLSLNRWDLLADWLLDPNKLKILHASKQDLEILLRLLGHVPAPLFDTQIANALSGGNSQVGYAQLVADELGVQLVKDQTRTDWCRRPLSPAQLAYAAADVEHLGSLYQRLDQRLDSLGRSAWLAEEMAVLASPDFYAPSPQSAWRRAKAGRRPSAEASAALRALAAWREQQAVTQNRPRKWVLSDAVLVQLANARPTTVQALEASGILNAKALQRYGEALVQILGSLPDPAPPLPEALTPEQKTALQALNQHVQRIAAELGIEPQLIATRRELERWARGKQALRFMQGWRSQLIGAYAQALRPDKP